MPDDTKPSGLHKLQPIVLFLGLWLYFFIMGFCNG